MIKKLTTLLFICALMAAVASCISSDPYTPSGDPDKGRTTKEDPEKPEEPDEPTDPEQPTDPLTKDILSAVETVARMGAGWNLGNTLDSHSGDTTNMWIEAWTQRKNEDYEKAWGQVPATKELFKMLRKKGFRSVRIPVTWYPHMGTDFNFGTHAPIWYPSKDPLGYTVDASWMARVKEVVDYALEADLYCIVNVHHDTGTSNTHWVVASMDNYAENCDRFKGLWAQIAETFKDYDGRLLFEAYNEMTDDANSWCFASYGTPDKYDAGMARSAYDAVNAYAQDFVDVVRSTGGNNAQRNLIVNTYAACSGEGEWNPHLKDPLKEMKLPEDTVEDRLIFQVHYYPNFSSAAAGKSNVDKFIAGLNDYLVPKGAPVIVGEWGAGGDSQVNYDKSRNSYLEFASYFVKQAKANGIATFYWMGVTDGQDRSVPKFTQEDLADAIIAGIK